MSNADLLYHREAGSSKEQDDGKIHKMTVKNLFTGV
jgi:hypothetical protein